MHIKRIELRDIKSIEHFDMFFDKGAGWHVLLGDNGSGKSTIIKAVAAALVGMPDIYHLEDWKDWVRIGKTKGKIKVEFEGCKDDSYELDNGVASLEIQKRPKWNLSPSEYEEQWSEMTSWFSCAYGPYRRFKGEIIADEVATRRLNAHLTAFDPKLSLMRSIEVLKKLHHESLEIQSDHTKEKVRKVSKKMLEDKITFINNSDLLPHGYKIKSVKSHGVYFTDSFGNERSIYDLSDGYKSMLSLVLDLMMHMQKIFCRIVPAEDPNIIHHSGVVMIDEVDVHLHPTWQVRIGKWFTKYFPNIQFIVTTHSPLICQAADSIWKLSEPDSETANRKIEGIEFQRLVYGNVLEAYGTGLFGRNVTRSETSYRMLERLVRLNKKSSVKDLTPEEWAELEKLKAILPTQK